MGLQVGVGNHQGSLGLREGLVKEYSDPLKDPKHEASLTIPFFPKVLVSSLFRGYLEGHGGLVGRLVTGIVGFILWLIGTINLLTKSP